MATLPRDAVLRNPAHLYLAGALLPATASVIAHLLTTSPTYHWGALGLLPFAAWSGYRFQQTAIRRKATQAIASRLDRLPSEFVVLHDVTVPAPWGQEQIGHLILSKYGIVVAMDGQPHLWMLKKVEAVRSLLCSRGVAPATVPVRPLVLLAPGSAQSGVVESDAPCIRVEHVRLSHVAPSQMPVLRQDQVNAMALALSEFVNLTA